MKYNKYLILGLISLFTGCADMGLLPFEDNVEKPESLEKQEKINSYDCLKNYLDDNNPDFRLGSGIPTSLFDAYLNKGAIYTLLNTNYSELTPGSQMKHGSIVGNDGKMDFDKVRKFVNEMSESEMKVFGHTLCWHKSMNVNYFNSLIAPDEPVITWNELVKDGGFDNDVLSESFSLEGGLTGNINDGILETVSKSDTNDATLYLKLPENLKTGDIINISFKIKSLSDIEKINVQGYTGSGDFLKGWILPAENISTDWKEYKSELIIGSGKNGLENLGIISFALGKLKTDITCWFDDFSVKIKKETNESDKTPQEKAEILSKAMESWIAGMMDACKVGGEVYVKSWDVVNEPIDNESCDDLRRSNNGKPSDDEIYWPEYLGDNYPRIVIKYARQYGGDDLNLFINDYALEIPGKENKVETLIRYIEQWEEDGITHIDGIGTQMHVSYSLDPDYQKRQEECVVNMFKKLAATGKLVKISELDMGVIEGESRKKIFLPEVTEEMNQRMAEYYKFIIKAYFDNVPKNQRYGIFHWSPIDAPVGSGIWREGEPIGLWNQNYQRKITYVGFAEGLKECLNK